MSAPRQGKRRNASFIFLWFHEAMRGALLLLLLLLSGCDGLGFYAAAETGSVIVFGRGVADIGVSAVTGRDCSIVRLDKGQTYCATRDPKPRPQPYCTPTLGTVTCWEDPGLLPRPQQEVADTPPPTPDQLRYRAARWPKSLFF